MDDSIKHSNFGWLADVAFGNHKSTFASQAAFMGLTGGVFAIVAFVFGWVSLAVVWPAMPNFTGNQIITDGIILGIISIPMLLIVAIFMTLQSAATVVVCKHHGRADSDMATTIKNVAKAALPAISVLFAQILVFVPFLAIFALIIAFNLSAIEHLAPPLFFVLFLILVVLRTFSFFAINLALDGNEKHRFLSCLLRSAKKVMQAGLVRIFSVTFIFTTINLGLFISLMYTLLVVFGQYPADWLEFFAIFYNPMGVASLLFLSYLIMIFVTPKAQIFAYTMYHSLDVPTGHGSPGLASRSLAVALDVAIIGPIFSLCFYGAASLVSGGGFVLSQMNLFAAVIAIIAFFGVFTVYNIFFETIGNGQTPAKHIFGLIVCRADGTNIDFVQSLVRNVLRIVDIFGFVAIIFNKDHRRLGDILSLAIVEYKEDADVSR